MGWTKEENKTYYNQMTALFHETKHPEEILTNELISLMPTTIKWTKFLSHFKQTNTVLVTFSWTVFNQTNTVILKP